MREQLRQVWSDPGQRKAAVAEVDALFEEAAKALEAPPAGAEAAVAAWEQEAASAGPLARSIVASPDLLRRTAGETETYLAMLRAAVAVRLGGEAALKDVPDPFGGGGPFQYRPLDGGGFELVGALVLLPGRPETASMRFPEPATATPAAGDEAGFD